MVVSLGSRRLGGGVTVGETELQHLDERGVIEEVALLCCAALADELLCNWAGLRIGLCGRGELTGGWRCRGPGKPEAWELLVWQTPVKEGDSQGEIIRKVLIGVSTNARFLLGHNSLLLGRWRSIFLRKFLRETKLVCYIIQC